MRTVLLLSVLFGSLVFSSSGSAQFDTRVAISVEAGGGLLMDAEEAEDASVILPGGLGSLMVGARVGQLRESNFGTLSFTLAYQGSVFADSSAILHRHHVTAAMHFSYLTLVVGGGPSVLSPIGANADDYLTTWGGSITLDMRWVFGRSGVFVGIPFKIDFFPATDIVLMQTALSLGFQTF